MLECRETMPRCPSARAQAKSKTPPDNQGKQNGQRCKKNGHKASSAMYEVCTSRIFCFTNRRRWKVRPTERSHSHPVHARRCKATRENPTAARGCAKLTHTSDLAGGLKNPLSDTSCKTVCDVEQQHDEHGPRLEW